MGRSSSPSQRDEGPTIPTTKSPRCACVSTVLLKYAPSFSRPLIYSRAEINWSASLVTLRTGSGQTRKIREGLRHAVDGITNNRQRWVDFMMRFELGLERPDPARAPTSAATIAASYLVGGLILLAPYIATTRIDLAFKVSVLLTGLPLIVCLERSKDDSMSPRVMSPT